MNAAVVMNKDQQRSIEKALRSKERADARAAFPIPVDDLRGLFDELDRRLSEEACDDTRRFAQAWLERKGLEVERTFRWFAEHGGYCDCEILPNVEQHVVDALAEAAK
jgi:hypothetical protein